MTDISHLNYLPLALPFFSILAAIFIVLMALIELGVLRYAYLALGISSRTAFLLLLASLLGSYINIPVAQLPAREIVSNEEIWFFGMRYVVPAVTAWPGTVIAVNLGGAVVPTLLSVYLLGKHRLWGRGLVEILVVAAVCNFLAQPVAGVGIGIPVFVPPITAALTASLLSPSLAAPLAYIGGSLGTLIGADLLNLGKIEGLGAPVASIGGAGTFDGIFLSGIFAVLIASLSAGPVPRDRAA